jgi:mRNA interferase HigB
MPTDKPDYGLFALFEKDGTRTLPKRERLCYNYAMRIISRKALRAFWERHPDAQQALQAWYADVKHAAWASPIDVKQTYRTASILPNNRVVFNIKGNQYRLVVAVNYAYGMVYIRYVGTHAEYDRMDASNI